MTAVPAKRGAGGEEVEPLTGRQWRRVQAPTIGGAF